MKKQFTANSLQLTVKKLFTVHCSLFTAAGGDNA